MKPIVLVLLLSVCVIVETALISDFAVDAQYEALIYVVWLLLPIEIFSVIYLEQALGGAKVNIATNYRVMEVVIRRSTVTSISLSYPSISGTYTTPSAIEFLIENTHLPDVVSPDVEFNVSKRVAKHVTFEDVSDVYEVERIIHEHRNKSALLVVPSAIVATSATSSAIMMSSPDPIAAQPSPATLEFAEIFLNEASLPQPYLQIFDKHNDVGSDDTHGQPPLGCPLYITKPYPYMVLWRRISPILILWLWLSALFILPRLLTGRDNSRLLQPIVIVMWLLGPFVLSAFVYVFSGESHPVDVLTSTKILLFRTGLQLSSSNNCSWGARMKWFSYRYAFPMLCVMHLENGRGSLVLPNLQLENIKLASGAGVVERQEIIFRNHIHEVLKQERPSD